MAPVCHETVSVPEGVKVPYTPEEVAREVIECAGMGASLLRYGLEDSFLYGEGKLARTNMDILESLLRLLGLMDLEPMTASEARVLMGIKN